MNHNKLFTKVTLIVLLIIFTMLDHTYAKLKNEVDLVTTPTKILFNIDRLVPGDWATRELVIKNNGKGDFRYLSSAKLTSGSEKLYNALLLKITDEDGFLFDGKLSDFKKLEPRLLGSNTEEKLIFSIEMPYELGNDFQGLSSKFEFKFYVEGTLGGVLPVDGSKLPDTSTNMFNILLAGSVLVLGGTILQFYKKRRDRHS